jgi:hypothetical protein
MKETMEDLLQRLDNPDNHSVAGKLNREILDGLNVHSPMNLMADEFNQAAERYYRDRLRKLHVAESFRILEEDFSSLCTDGNNFGSDDRKEAVHGVLEDRNLWKFLTAIRNDVMEERATEDDLRRLIHLMLISIDYDAKQSQVLMEKATRDVCNPTSIYRTG